MKFNATAISTLYFRVSVKKRPYSDEEICILITASDYTKTNNKGKLLLGKTLFFRELPIFTEQASIDANIEQMRKVNNFSTAQVL